MESERKISHNERKVLWIRASGAAASLRADHDSDYYQFLKSEPLNYPNPSFHQIELDLPRTFTLQIASDADEQGKVDMIARLRSVL